MNRPPLRRRLLAAALTVYTVVVASGAPLPAGWVIARLSPPTSGDAPTERYPCENCPCGCGTAQRCWTSCCCHTPAQRLAWSRREGVRPPEFALDAAERAGLDVSPWRESKLPGKPVETTPPVSKTPACYEKTADLPPCCRAKASCCQPATTPPSDEPSDPGVALLHALACQGLAEAWLAMGEAPLPAPLEPVEGPPLAERVTVIAPPIASRRDAPAPPPPDTPAFS